MSAACSQWVLLKADATTIRDTVSSVILHLLQVSVVVREFVSDSSDWLLIIKNTDDSALSIKGFSNLDIDGDQVIDLDGIITSISDQIILELFHGGLDEHSIIFSEV